MCSAAITSPPRHPTLRYVKLTLNDPYPPLITPACSRHDGAPSLPLDIKPESRKPLGNLLALFLDLGPRRIPARLRPNLDFAELADDYRGLVQRRVLAQKRGDEHAPLPIEFAFRCTREDEPLEVPHVRLSGRQLVQLLSVFLPLLRGVNHQTTVESASDDRAFAQLQAEPGRYGQAPLAVQAMREFT